MSAAVPVGGTSEITDVPTIARAAFKLGAIEAVLVLATGWAIQLLEGPVEFIVCGALVFVGVVVVATLPGIWTRAQGIDGIACSAGIGLGAALVFMVIDIALVRPVGTYTNRWDQIGGFSNWWYHPIWWMLGTFVPWMGALSLAGQAAKSGRPSVPALAVTLLIGAIVLMGIAVAVHFPGARFTLGTFSVSLIPALGVVGLLGLRNLYRK